MLGTPFYSLKDRGTGIGLTVCYSIVQKYKGKIVVQSELNKGTSFTIYLPLHREID
ncbi:ATP-binding protein [Peribacillus simplex]|uniref:ATP-binding protein n=1 Tax=Peribacillus simplex TaxID=1478 RepID=UPI0035C6EC00